MKKYIILILNVCLVFLSSCVQISTGNVSWYLCIRSDDTLDIEMPTYDKAFGSFGKEDLIRQKAENGHLKTFGDVYISGDYLYTNKDKKYRYTERHFAIRRLSDNAEIKAFVLYSHTSPYEYGWIPADISKRDSVFEVLIRHYGEDNIHTMSVNQKQMNLVYHP